MNHPGHSEGHTMEGEGAGDPNGGFPVDSLLGSFPGAEQNQLLEMLHMPLLHGGVREVLLLAPLTTTSPASFALACFVLALSAGLLELLRLLLWWVEGQYTSGTERIPPASICLCKQCIGTPWCNNERKGYEAIHDLHANQRPTPTPTPTPTDQATPLSPKTTGTSTAIRQACYACAGMLHLLTYLASTLLMLIAMTMNVYLILSMGVGGALGKLASLALKRKLLQDGCK
ncbi:hypothetical protein Pcinc_003863 [Petrolisthes cinctipes]|uniref:Copper transport protein n=1 Tax=Petrolisthes cinctipes TaxID=88211 RepID=A0AAE1GGW2_PETCI|nr:hypothetical protein Pcinc_003863 [Petrolisthes cinctipes]